MGKSVRVKSFDLVAQDISEADLHLLHALSTGVGWPHRPADWDFLRQVGQGIVAVDAIGRVFGSAMWFPQGDNFATIGLVITTPRAQAQGAGRWLMDQVMERCKGRNLSLNSTKAAYPLYLSLGFNKEAIVFLHRGKVSDLPAVAPTGGTLAELTAARVGEIAACDTQAFGADRSRVLAQLSEKSVTCVLQRNGESVGYAMRRPFGGLQVIGPIVASNDEDAIQLAAWHLRAMKGRSVRIDTREEAGPFAELLTQCGLAVAETTITMSKGRRFLNRTAAAPWVYGLAGHALS
jgi:GNAT superfamily N-acetyltransferase